MKLFKLLPLAALVFSISAASAYADVGKNGSDVEHICDKVAASLIKQDRKTPVSPQAPAGAEVKQEPNKGSTAM